MPPRGRTEQRRRQRTRPGPIATRSTLAAGTLSGGFNFLPQELVDLIVDNLEDDISSLEACSLTSRAFLASSRRYQFSEIELTGLPLSHQSASRPQMQTLCDKFLALIERSPHIAPLVKDLSILEGGVPWLANRRSPLPLVLRQLVNLEHISIGDPGRSMDWSLLPRRVRESLMDILHSPKLQSVILMAIDELPHPSKLFPAVEESSLNEISLIEVNLREELQNSADSPPSLPLTFLQLAIFEQQLVSFLGYFKNMLAGVQVLTVVLAEVEDFSSAWQIIERSTALSDLKIGMYWSNLHAINGTFGGTFPNLKDHSKLQSMRFDMNFIGLAANLDLWNNPLTWIVDVLNTITPVTPINEVFIDIAAPFPDLQHHFRSAVWSRMDALLTNTDVVLAPCKLTVKLIPEDPHNAHLEVYETLRRRILESMPQLRSRNLVVVECEEAEADDESDSKIWPRWFR